MIVLGVVLIMKIGLWNINGLHVLRKYEWKSENKNSQIFTTLYTKIKKKVTVHRTIVLELMVPDCVFSLSFVMDGGIKMTAVLLAETNIIFQNL